MAVAETVQVPEAFVEVTVYSNERQCPLLSRRQKTLHKAIKQENPGTMATHGGFPIHKAELLTRLDRGEEAWVPDLQSSDESADEGPIRPTLKRWPKGRMWWDWYRNPVTSANSDSANSDNEESDGEERRGYHKLTILRRNVLGRSKACKNRPQVKKYPRKQLGRIRSNLADLAEASEGAAKEIVGQEYQYSCPGCGRAFKSKMSLSNHKRIHFSQKSYGIPSCRKMFLSKKALASYRRRYAEERGYKHPNRFVKHSESIENKPFKCLDCDKHFKWKYRLTEHQRSHTGERPHVCSVCGNAFMRKEHLNRHQKIHIRKTLSKSSESREEKRETMDVRQDTCKPPIKLNTNPCSSDSSVIHTATSVSEGPTGNQNASDSNCVESLRNLKEEELYKCQYCEECFSEQTSLEKHEGSHKEKKSCQCPECGKIFSHKRYLAQHEKTHKEQKNPTFKSTRSLRLKSHGSVPEKIQAGLTLKPRRDPAREGIVTRSLSLARRPKPHKCQYCGKCKKTKTALISHEKAHRSEKPFQCTECGQNFLKRNGFYSHQRSHLRKKLSKCSDLDKKATTKTPSSPGHKKSHRKKLPCFCFECGKSFNHKSTLHRHQRTHFKKPFKCNECGKEFIQTWHLKRHEEVHLKDEHNEKSIGTEISCELSKSSNGLSEKASSEEGKPQAASDVLKINTFQGVREEETGPQAVLTESFGLEAAGNFEQEDIFVKAPLELCGESKRDEGQKHLQEEIFVGQVVKPGRKLGQRDTAVLQDKHCFSQQIRPKICPRKTSLRRHNQEKMPARWLLRSQTMTRRKSKQAKMLAGQQDKSCFCQRNGHEIPRTKSKNSKGCKKVKACSVSQRTSRSALSSKLFKTVPKLNFHEVPQRRFSGETNMEATGSGGETKTEATGSGGKTKMEAIGSPGETIMEATGSGGETNVEAIGSAGETKMEATGSAGETRMEATGSGGETRLEAIGSGVETNVEATGNAGETKMEATGSAGETKMEATGSAGENRMEAIGSAGETNMEAIGSARETRREAIGSAVETKMEATGSTEQLGLSCSNQEMELQEPLRTESKGNSGSGSHVTEKEELVDINEQAEPSGMPLIPEGNVQQNNSVVQASEIENVNLQNLKAVSANQQPKAQISESGVEKKSSLGQNCKEERGYNGPEVIPIKSQRTTQKEGGTDNDCKAENMFTNPTCVRCQKSFKNQGCLLIHEKMHIKDRLFVCTECQERFYSAAALKVHMQIHVKEKLFKCSKCEFRCNTISILNKHHKRIHSPKKPFPCQRCGRSFWFNHGLIIHLKTHSKKNGYVPSNCGQTFIHKNLLKLQSRCKHLEPVELARSKD